MKTQSSPGPTRELVGAVIAFATSRRLGEQVRHPDEVVGRGRQLGPQLVDAHASVAQLAPAPDRLHPPINLLGALAQPLTELVADLPGGAAVDGTALPGRVLSHMRS